MTFNSQGTALPKLNEIILNNWRAEWLIQRR